MVCQFDPLDEHQVVEPIAEVLQKMLYMSGTK